MIYILKVHLDLNGEWKIRRHDNEISLKTVLRSDLFSTVHVFVWGLESNSIIVTFPRVIKTGRVITEKFNLLCEFQLAVGYARRLVVRLKRYNFKMERGLSNLLVFTETSLKMRKIIHTERSKYTLCTYTIYCSTLTDIITDFSIVSNFSGKELDP